MTHLYRSVDNKSFSKPFADILKDKPAQVDIGEQETIFTSTKIGHHIADFSTFESNLPNILS